MRRSYDAVVTKISITNVTFEKEVSIISSNIIGPFKTLCLTNLIQGTNIKWIIHYRNFEIENYQNVLHFDYSKKSSIRLFSWKYSYYVVVNGRKHGVEVCVKLTNYNGFGFSFLQDVNYVIFQINRFM